MNIFQLLNLGLVIFLEVGGMLGGSRVMLPLQIDFEDL